MSSHDQERAKPPPDNTSVAPPSPPTAPDAWKQRHLNEAWGGDNGFDRWVQSLRSNDWSWPQIAFEVYLQHYLKTDERLSVSDQTLMRWYGSH